MKILIVDDSRMMRMVLRNIVKKLDHETIEAGDGEEALAVLAQHGYVDFILLDWNIPLMNGFAVLQAVRKQALYDKTKIIMVTTEAEIESVQQALTAGANDYIMKPFTHEIVQDKIALLASNALL
ncbi:MAG: response regulator [Mariprofundaceae bacterium]|nr:response regulator [Mariprofundaceae bacterium]